MLLPKVDLMVTNGGYGAVQRALSTECRWWSLAIPKTNPRSQRVAVGRGIDLRPVPHRRAVRNAVREVLGNGRYLRRARDLEAAYAQRDGVAEIALIDEVVGHAARR